MATDATIVVSIRDLRNALSRLLDAAEQQLGSTVNLAADHYWLIELPEMFSLDHEPGIGAGQLSDDVASIHEFPSRSDDELFLWHDLQHVAGVLLRLASLDLPSTRSGVI